MAGDAWDILPEETPIQFEKFRLYRDAGPKRTIRKSVEAFKDGKVASLNQVRGFQRVAERFDWKRRAMAWDAELDKERLQAEREEVEKMRRRHVQEARSLQAVGTKAIRRILEVYEQDGNPEISPSVAIQFIQQGINLERLSTGEATSIEEQLKGRTSIQIEWPGDQSEVDYGDDPPDAEAPRGAGEDPEE